MLIFKIRLSDDGEDPTFFGRDQTKKRDFFKILPIMKKGLDNISEVLASFFKKNCRVVKKSLSKL